MATDSQSPARIGRPPSDAARSHAKIMDAVYALVQEKPAREVSMEEVARRAGVGKPTLYKWWPSKAALIMAMFHERLESVPVNSAARTVEEGLLQRMREVIGAFNGLFGKVMADLVAEGQSDPRVLEELHEHVLARRAQLVAEIERGKASGELLAETDAELVVDAIFGPAYYRLLLGFPPLEQKYGAALVRQVLRGVRADESGAR